MICELRASQDDTGTELSGPGQPELVHVCRRGWLKGHTTT